MIDRWATYRRQAKEHKSAGADSMWIAVDDLLDLLEWERMDVDLLQTVAESMGITASLYYNRRSVWQRVADEYARIRTAP